MKRLPIPQREFAFVSQTFSLVSDTGVDGERIAREREELEVTRRASEAAQRMLFPKRSAKAKRHRRRA